jgi:hypothetical protein
LALWGLKSRREITPESIDWSKKALNYTSRIFKIFVLLSSS